MRISRLLYSVLFLVPNIMCFQSFGSNIDPGSIISIGAGTSQGKFKTKKNDTSQQNISFATAPVYNAELGYRFNRFFRAGINPQVRIIRCTDGIEHAKARSAGALVNLYLDLDNYSKFTPYAMAGIGYGGLSLKKGNPQKYQKFDRIGPLFNFGAGLQVAIGFDAGIDIMFRYVDLGKFKMQKTTPDGTITSPLVQAQPLRTQEILLSIYYLLG